MSALFPTSTAIGPVAAQRLRDLAARRDWLADLANRSYGDLLRAERDAYREALVSVVESRNHERRRRISDAAAMLGRGRTWLTTILALDEEWKAVDAEIAALITASRDSSSTNAHADGGAKTDGTSGKEIEGAHVAAPQGGLLP